MNLHFILFSYLSYMPLCCVVGLTGNCMVVILIRSILFFTDLFNLQFVQFQSYFQEVALKCLPPHTGTDVLAVFVVSAFLLG